MNIDEKIAEALEKEFEERVEQSLAATKKHRFSLAYRLWERKMLKNLRRGGIDKRWTLKKAKSIVISGIAAVSILAGGTAFASVNMVRERVIDKRDRFEMFFENLQTEKTAFKEYYGLSGEDGWEITEHFIIDNWESHIKYKLEEKEIAFDQYIICAEIIGNINAERPHAEVLSLYTENDGFTVDHRKNRCSIYWLYDGYLLKMEGNLSKDEIIELARSVKTIKTINEYY